MKTKKINYDKLAGIFFTTALVIFTLKMFILPIGLLVGGDYVFGAMLLTISLAIAVGVFFFIRWMWKEINSGFEAK